MNKAFDPAAPVIIDPPAITRPDVSRAEEVIDKVIKLDLANTNNAFEMGDLLVEVVDGDYFAAAHCESLKDFLQKNQIDISKREADYRIKSSRVSAKLGISRTALMKAKISKVKVIFELNPELEHKEVDGTVRNVGEIMVELVQRAGSGMSLKDVRERVDEIKMKADPDSVLKWLNLPTTLLNEEFVMDTINMAKKLCGDSGITSNNPKETEDAISTATAIAYICGEARSGFGLEPADYGSKPTTFSDSNEFVDSDGTKYEAV